MTLSAGEGVDFRDHLQTSMADDGVTIDLRGPSPELHLAISNAPPVTTGAPRWPAGAAITKRTFDLVLAGVLLFVVAPLLLVIYGLIRFSSDGPALYRQERVGRAGVRFTCLKFRSMYIDAEDRLSAILAVDARLLAEWSDAQKLRSDPRVTRIGRILRRTNLDELPQLFNILKGEMSAVGPRPVVPGETVKYGSQIHKVLSVRPGLTGLWQVSGRNDLPYAERVRLDVAYVDSHSLWGDLRICVRTVFQMLPFRNNGAY